MRTRTNKHKFFLGALFGFVVFGVLLGVALWLTSAPSLAVTVDPNLGTTFGLGTADLQSTVIKIVQWALGFLGLVAVIIIMYGGFVWLTAAGNEDKVRKAKKIITQAVIGLIIILLAWAIVTFIIGRLNNAINGNGGNFCTPGAPNGCYRCNGAGSAYSIYDSSLPGCGGGAATFHWIGLDPAPNEDNVPLCSIVQAQFNGDFLATSIPGNVGLYVDAATSGNGAACTTGSDCRSGECTASVCVGDAVAGTWQVDSSDHSLLYFLPAADYLADTRYRAEINAGVQEDATTPRATVPVTWTFTTGTTTLDTPPTVTQIYPDDDDTNICLMTPIQVRFSQKMFMASLNTTTVKFFNITDAIDTALKSPFSYPGSARYFTTRPAAPMLPGKEFSVSLVAGTTGNSDPQNGIMDICLNHLDGNYNTADQGSPNDDFMSSAQTGPPPNPPNETYPWSFTADTDTTNTKCVPEITEVNPAAGQYNDPAPGVTISGTNFGIIGNVTFSRGVLDILNCFSGVNWPNQNCVASWNGTTIQTRVPGGPINYGDIIPSNGARDGGVVVTISPGVCEGGTNANGACTVANEAADCPGGGKCIEDSNAVDFDVASPQIGEVSALSDQPHGGIGQYVTISKRSDSNAGFGSTRGQVFFRNRTSGAEVVAEFPPDPPCPSTWKDGAVIVKVPDLSAIATACAGNWASCVNTNSEVAVQVVKSDGTRSNLSYFVYTNEAAGPGVCDIAPECGTQGTGVTLLGENIDGPNPHSVNFRLGTSAPVSATPTSWSDTSAGANVPLTLDNSSDPPYKVNVSNGTNASNTMDFTIPCGGVPRVQESSVCALHCVGGDNDGRTCTTDAFCAPGGGSCVQDQYPSPNPYKNATRVCLNAVFGATFNTLMTHASLSDANIKLYDCTDNTSSCVTTNDITPPLANFSASDTATNTSFQMIPSANLTPDHYYKVTISKEVTNTSGVRMNGDYSWVVQTQTGTEECPLSSVLVTPARITLTAIDPDPGSTQNYIALPMGARCTFLNPATYTWSWSSSNAAIASVLQNIPPYQATATALSDTYPYYSNIIALTEGKSGQGRLNVDLDYCTASTDCTKAGLCPNSVCDIARNKCTPVINSMSPDPVIGGPRGQTVTINGCYFGSTQGQVVFGAGNQGLFLCPSPWRDAQIKTTIPDSVNLGLNSVEVITSAGLSNIVHSGQTVTFNVNNTCTGVSMPGLCSITPPSALNGERVTFNGFNFTASGAPPIVKGQFTDDGGNYVDAADGTSSADGETFSGVTVPNTAATGYARVAVDDGAGSYCYSNAVDFGVRCTSRDQCSTGCCAYSSTVHAKICQPLAACSTGGPGTTCQLPTNNPYCQIGPLITSDDYRCIDTLGHRDPNSPAGQTYPPDPDATTTCITCCYPGQTNAGGLSCVTDKGACSGANRGLYCGCTPGNDPRCGDTNTYACGTDTCCYMRPQFVGVTPAVPTPPDELVCLNNVFTFTFSEDMNVSSVVPGTSISMRDITANQDIAITVQKKTDGFSVKPSAVLVAGHTVRISLRRDLILSAKGIAWSGTANDTQTWEWPISSSASVCTIDTIDWTFVKESEAGPWFVYAPPDYYNCVSDNCTDDMDVGPGSPGNQHWVVATALDRFGNGVAATYNWSVGNTAVAQIDDTMHGQLNTSLTAQAHNGRTTVNVEAVPDYFAGPKTSSARVTVDTCEHPWPNPFPPENDTYPFIDAVTHYSVAYCRDPGNLPLLARTSDVVVKAGSYVSGNGQNELIREFFFTRANTDDAIGIRVYENENDQSARDWYYTQFGPAAPEPQNLTVDGYPAVRAGRSVYVAAWNAIGPNVGDRLYPNVYLISYNEGASDETISIYNRMIDNWEFNINIAPTEKEEMLRDLQRATDLSSIYSKLLTYRTDKGSFPKLEGGSYVKMLSTSKWPSWQDALGAALNNSTLPHDPIDKFTVADPPVLCSSANRYDQNTCWSDTLKRYECPSDSFVYQYLGSADGSRASLFAHLEYIHYFNGGWYIGADPITDACSGLTEAECPCFNYEYNVTGTATDHDGPDITAVDSLVLNQVTTVSGTRALGVTVSDTGSGVARVEFYVDGILKFTDTDNASWSWDFATAQYADGDHMVRVRAYDNAGNLTDRDYAVRIDNAGQPDTTSPFVTITAPRDGTTVSNRNVTYSPDKFITASGVVGIEATNSGSLFWVNYSTGTSSLNRVDADLNANTLLNTFNYPNADPQLNLVEGNRRLYWVGKDRATGDMLATYTSNAPGDVRKILRIPAGAAPNTPPSAIYYFTGAGFDPRGFTHAVGTTNGKIIAIVYFSGVAVYNPASGAVEAYQRLCPYPSTCIGGVDTDSSGNIYVTRTDTGSVQKYDQQLNLLNTITDASLRLPLGIAIDGQTAYVANQNSHDIVAVDTNLTKLVHVFGEAGVPGADTAHLNAPQDVAIVGNNLYISDHLNGRVLRVKTLISYGVQINALATDNRQVSSVNFTIRDSSNNLVDAYACTNNTTTSLTCSFAPPWDTTQVANGAYTITAIAADSGGRTGTTSVAVNVNNLDPVRPAVAFDQMIPGVCAQGACPSSGDPCDYRNACANGEQCVFGVACDQSNTTTVCTDTFPADGVNNQICLRRGSVSVPVTATDNKQVDAVKFYVDGLFKSDGIHLPGTCVSGGQSCGSDTDCTAPDTCALNRWNWSWDTQGQSRGVCASHCSITATQSCVATSDCPTSETCVNAAGIGLSCNADDECASGLTCPGHQVVAYAYDDAGNVGTDTMFIPIDVAQDDSVAPTVTFVPPTPNEGTSIDNTITIAVDAADDYGVNRVNFYMDYVLRYTVFAGQDTSWTLDTASIPDGWHSFQVDALDARGNRSTSIERNYSVRGPGGPLISDAFVTPDSGPEGTTYTIYATVTDYDGVDSVIAPIQSPDETDLQPTAVNITMARISGSETSGLYRGTWTSDRVAVFWIDVQARDVQGNTSEYENIPGRATACNNNGTCEYPVEDNANCPADCPANIPVITSVLSTSGQVGIAFSYQIVATNSPTSYGSGALPSGLSLNTGTGLISGTPAAGSEGTYSVSISATNAFGTDTKSLTIVLSGPCVAHNTGPCTGALTGNDNCCLATDFCSHNGTKTNPADDTCVSKHSPPSPCDYSFWCTTGCCDSSKRCSTGSGCDI